MTTKQYALTITGTVIVSVLIWFFWPANDIDRIKQNFDRLAKAVSKDSSHGAYDLLNKKEEIEALLTEDIRIEMDHPMHIINNRKQLISMYHSGYFFVTALTVAFHDISITLAPAGEKAEAHCTVTVTSPDIGDSIDAREIIVNWIKTDGTWMIKEAHDIPTLR